MGQGRLSEILSDHLVKRRLDTIKQVRLTLTLRCGA